MLFNTLYRLRGFGIILGIIVLTFALTACSNAPPTDDPGQPIPNGNDNSGDPTDPQDQDGDGVPDDIDECPGTAPGAMVDEAGCPLTQPGGPDEDGDGVTDDDDACPETPAGEQVDDEGCAASQLDSDDDGVSDADDLCPGTPDGEEVDDDGCAPSQLDSDDDGVSDADDLCLETPDGEQVDDDGCGASQLDSDDDGVSDADDRCSETPAGEEVDDNGCAESQLVNDSDGDGVLDPNDVCPETPEGEQVDDDGCAASQLDSDDDGVTDDLDECPGTAPGERVDETGCVVGGGGGGGGHTAVCGNGVLEAGEQCDPPDGVTCDDNCQTIGEGECGNGVVEAGEQCDPPDGVTCDDNCQTIGEGECGNGVVEGDEECDPPDGITCDEDCRESVIPLNDGCGNAATIGDGTIQFHNIGATTDGPDEPVVCDFFDYTHVESDVWFCYTATCTHIVTVSLCGSSYDTKLAVYAGCECPTEVPLTCSDDNCGLYAESRVTLGANEGDSFLIRAGGYDGEQGDGFLTIICGDAPSCAAGVGDCFEANGSPTCEDVECCNTVCGIDQYCCDVDWDDYCAGEATEVCGGTFAACVEGTGDCYAAHETRGCEDERCCQAVCLEDPFCCLTEWDEVCAEGAVERCAMFDVCATATESCLRPHRDPGCSDEECCLFVCENDPSCCLDEWDDVCVEHAADCP